jgi:DNA-binding sugar fermentation-stimulating protein
MLGCVGDGWPVKLSLSDNPKRKYPHTLEMVHNGTCWIGINTQRANPVVEVLAYRADVGPEEIRVVERVAVDS